MHDFFSLYICPLRCFYKKFYSFRHLFIFDCAGSLLLHTGFLQLWRVGLLCCGVQLLIAVASLVAEHRLQAQGVSICSTQPR